MFKLEVEMSLRYVPPMSEHRRSIVLTSEFDIPFPPFSNLFLSGDALNDHPTADGFKLEFVTWDIDRHVFMARTSHTSHDLPIGFIPYDIRSWLDRGWKFGSLEDRYPTSDDEIEFNAEINSRSEEDDGNTSADDHSEKWQTLPPRRRPKKFNVFLKALVRMMAETFDNLHAAYAIDKTKMVFSEREIKEDRDSPDKRAFWDAELEYRGLPDAEQFAWRDQVIKNYPSLENVIADW
jgi:hypothetical protein